MGKFTSRRAVLFGSVAAAFSIPSLTVFGQTPRGRRPLKEPVYRISKTATKPMGAAKAPHPLDPALKIAREGLQHIQRDIRDYTSTVVKRERINGKLNDHEYMFAKIRNRKVVDGREVVPFSVYMKFLKPANIKGREVIYVAGKNKNKMCAHEGGSAGRFLPTVWLNPTGLLAMRGQRYPIYDLGIENLIMKLIEKGERDEKRDECEVKFFYKTRVSGRVCTYIQVSHPKPRSYFDFHIARIFIDDELQVPIRYAAYQWPTKEGGKPVLDEEYTYLNVKLNVGLTDADFDTKNANYNF